MRRVTLRENDTVGAYISATDPELRALVRSGLVEVHSGRAGWRVIPLAGMAGVVRVGDLEIDVRPKARFDSLLFMLGYARDPAFRPDEVSSSRDEDLWPVVAETLARLTERALLSGVLQGYSRQEEALPLVRGRIDFATQLRERPHLPLPIAVVYDDYTEDILENRILRAAVRAVNWYPRLSTDTRARLHRLDSMLRNASPLADHRGGSWFPSRSNARYQPALRLADVILRSSGADEAQGPGSLAAFVVDMPALFEDFVATALSEAFTQRSPGRTIRHDRLHLDWAGRLAIQPDVVHRAPDRQLIIADAKYKIGSASGHFSVADLYQLLAYCTVTRSTQGWLIYAGSLQENSTRQVHDIVETDVTIVQWPLDLSMRPGNLLAQVGILVDEMLAQTRALVPA